MNGQKVKKLKKQQIKEIGKVPTKSEFRKYKKNNK